MRQQNVFLKVLGCGVLGLASLVAGCATTSTKVVQLSDDGREMSVQLSTNQKSILAARPVKEANDARSAFQKRETLSNALLISVAELSLIAGNIDDAEKQARAILKRDIKNLGAAQTLMKVTLLRQQYEAAELMGRNALAHDPRNVDVIALLGLANYLSGNVIEAREQWKKALAINPRHIPSQMNLGALYFQNRNVALADSMFERVLKIQPSHPDAMVGHALVMSSQGRHEEAKKVLLTLLDKHAESPLILYNLSVIEKERYQNYKSSLAYLNRYLEVAKNDRATVERAIATREELKGLIAKSENSNLSDKDLRQLADKSSQAVQEDGVASNTAEAPVAPVAKAAVKEQQAAPAAVQQQPAKAPVQSRDDDVRSLEEDIK